MKAMCNELTFSIFTESENKVFFTQFFFQGILPDQYYLISNGKRFTSNDTSEQRESIMSSIHVVPRTLGGKGGFGSMLRAIGAQIEKTTNREACRDLSGRRLRDINEEQRLKKWVAQQAEREKEEKERRKKKLEKMLEQPKHVFKDEEYDKERSTLPEKIEDAVLQGLEASCSGIKRKSDDVVKKPVKKKRKLWVDSELDELSSDGTSSDSEGEDNKVSTSQSLNSQAKDDSSENSPKNDLEEDKPAEVNK